MSVVRIAVVRGVGVVEVLNGVESQYDPVTSVSTTARRCK